MASTVSTSAPTKPRRTWLNQRKLAPYLFIAPFYLLFVGFFLGPSLFALVLSLYRWHGLGLPKLVGLKNYTDLFADPVFHQAAWNTTVYALANILWIIPLALVLAVALNAERLHFKTFWRWTFFSPVVTSTVAVILVFGPLFNRDYGLFNAPLIALGMKPIAWLNDNFWVKPAIILLLTWRATGFTMIYFLAGLQNIPRDMYEAAAVDGATKRQAFWYITIPLLRPVILFVIVFGLIGSLQIFEEPYLLTGGGPSYHSISVAGYLYNKGVQQLEYGYASTVGVVLFVVIGVLSAIQLRWLEVFRED